MQYNKRYICQIATLPRLKFKPAQPFDAVVRNGCCRSSLNIAESVELDMSVYGLNKALLNSLPVNNLPDGLEVLCLAVLVLEAIR